jgi:hypothetical protein
MYKKFFKKMFRNCIRMGNKNCLKNRVSPTTELSEGQICLLLKSTDMNREQIMDFHQNFLIDCPSGVITKKEFIKMFKQLQSDESRKQKAEKFTEYVFKYFYFLFIIKI